MSPKKEEIDKITDDEIKVLKKKFAESKLKVPEQNTLIDIAEEQLKFDIKKGSKL